jgi:hypothetical protein
MKINKMKSALLISLRAKLESNNQTTSKYYKHVCEELARRD